MQGESNKGPLNLGGASLSEKRDLINFIDKAVKAIKMYLPNNPQHKLFLGKVVGKFIEFFSFNPELRIEISRNELKSEGEIIYQSDDRSGSLAFVLFKDGLREIVITSGIDESEITGFIYGFNRDFTKEYLEDDLVTYFWEQNFRHIRYSATEDYLDEFLPQDISMAPNRTRACVEKSGIVEMDGEDIKGLITEEGTAGEESGVVLREAHLRKTAITETDEVKDRLRELVRKDAERYFFPFLREAVLNILKMEKDSQSVADLVDLLRKILELEISRGNLTAAVDYLGNIADLARGGIEYGELAAGSAQSLMQYISGEEFIGNVLGGAIIAFPDLDPDYIAQFVGEMPPASARNLLGLFEKIESMKARKAVCRGLALLAKEDINMISEGLDDDRWYVVRNTVFVLGMIQNSDATLYLKKALSHPDSRVRKEVIKAVFNLESADIDDYVINMLDDPDEKMRIYSLKNITPRLGSRVRTKLLEMAFDNAFKRKGGEEKKQLYRALVRAGGEEGMVFLEKFLLKKAFFKKDLLREQRWVVEALGASGSAAAQTVLSSAEKSGSKAVRAMCRAALSSGSHKQMRKRH